MQINDIFSKVYVVNLDRRPDRMRSVSDELNKNNIKFERFSAVNGNDITHSSGLTNGAVGCLLSHYQIIKKSYDEGAEAIFIFEDDIELCEDFENKFKQSFNEVPDDWQFLYLGCNKHENSVIARPTENVIKVQNAFSTACYGVRRDAMKKIIDTILDMKAPVDVYYGFLQTSLPAYTFKSPLCWQKPDWSDVENAFVDYRWIFERNS